MKKCKILKQRVVTLRLFENNNDTGETYETMLAEYDIFGFQVKEEYSLHEQDGFSKHYFIRTKPIQTKSCASAKLEKTERIARSSIFSLIVD